MDPWFIFSASVAGLLAFFFAAAISQALRSALVLDALAMGLFVSIGAAQSLLVDVNSMSAVFIAVVTATGGLVLRDILAGNAPTVLRPGVLVGVVALAGAVLFVVLVRVFGVALGQAEVVTALFVAVVRTLAVVRDWRTHEAHGPLRSDDPVLGGPAVSGEMIAIPDLLTNISITFGGMTGAMHGARKRMDLFGTLVMGVIVAIGAGIVRDLSIGRLPAFLYSSMVGYAILGGIAGYFLARAMRFINRTIFLIDTLLIGAWVCLGCELALQLRRLERSRRCSSGSWPPSAAACCATCCAATSRRRSIRCISRPPARWSPPSPSSPWTPSAPAAWPRRWPS